MDPRRPPFPHVTLGYLDPWEDPNYIPSGPMRETPAGSVLLPMPGQVPTSRSGASPGETTSIDDAWHQATLISGVVTPAAVANADQQPFLVAPNTRRNLLTVRNASVGGQNVYLEFGKAASTDTVILLAPNQILLFDNVVPQDDLYAAGDVAGARLVYAFSTIANI